MPIGPIINVLATLIGGFIGASLKKYIPQRLKMKMPQIFGLVALCLGIPLIAKINHSLSVVLAILLGTIIGELLQLDIRIEKVANKIKTPLEKLLNKSSDDNDDFMNQFIALLVLFSASGLGITGALNEGMSNDSSILIMKAILDFFTAIIFGTSLGYMVCSLAIPQAIVLFSLFFLGSFIMPLTTPEMLANFSSVGGIIMVATGFKITKIKDFSVVNMLPSLVLLIPIYLLLT